MDQQILNSQPDQINAEVVAAWLVDNLAEQLEVEPNEIDKCKPLENYGLDSAQGMIIVSRAEKQFGFEISPMLLWYYPTIEALAERLGEELTESDLEVLEI
ncbi:MAG: acyl carrier protein [Pleurocapsa sp.]